MGMSVFIAREVAAHRHNDQPYVKDLVGTVSAISWLAFLASSALVIAFAPWLIDHWLQIEVTNRTSATHALQMISIGLLLAIPRAVYAAVLPGYERVDLWNVANLLAVAVQQLGLILVLAAGGDLLHVAAWFGISAVLGLLPFLYLVYRVGGVRLLFPAWRIRILLRNMRFASHLFASSLSGFLVTQVDKWTISRFLPVSLLGYYSFAQGLVSKGGIVPGAIASAAFPVLSSGITGQPDSVWRAHYHKLQDFTCYVYFPVSAAVAMLGIVVTKFIFNDEVAELIWLPLLLLSIGQYLIGQMSVPYWLAIAAKRPEITLHANLWAFLFVIPAAVFLAYRYGLTGAAIASVLYAIWQLLYFIPRFCSQCLGSHASLWYRQAGSYFIIGLLAYGLPWSGAWIIGEGLSLTGLIGSYILGSLAFLLAGWFLVGPDLRTSLLHSLRALRIGRIVL
jgi:O-antigen/teichoic acid export membrane protein